MSHPFISWLTSDTGRHGIVRLYDAPLAPIVEGLPGQPWTWCCNFTLQGSRGLIQAASKAPSRQELKVLLDLARELGCAELVWERVKPEGLRHKLFHTGATRLVQTDFADGIEHRVLI